MAKKQSTEGTKVHNTMKDGPKSWRDLRMANENVLKTGQVSSDLQQWLDSAKQKYSSSPLLDVTRDAQQDIASPLSQMKTHTGGQDYWGNSFWDNDIANAYEFQNLGDIRAENQWGVAKLGNGILKSGITFGTTVLEAWAGLTSGLIFGAKEAAETEGGFGKKAGAFLHGLWDNPVTQAIQKLSDVSEEYLPNYYTQDEMENPWGHIFSANFLGDKIIKNLGFMVGAFYSGIPLAKGIGALSKARVASAMREATELAQGAGRRTVDLARQVNSSGLKGLAAERELGRLMAAEHLTEFEKGKKLIEGYDKVRHAAQTTKATSMAIGSVASAFNEGAIEAINNSRDWEQGATIQENDRHNAALQEIYAAGEETGILDTRAIEAENKEHETRLAEIQYGKARMGNADLLMNLPILTLTNMFELGHLYARGFDFNARRVKDFFKRPGALKGSLKAGDLASKKTWKGGMAKALLNMNAEGAEEFFQRVASEDAGKVVSDSIDKYLDAGEGEHAKAELWDYMSGFIKATGEQAGNPHAWEEYFIGAISSILGMPVVGSQTRNAYMKLGNVGFAGGAIGAYHDYMNEKKEEDKIAKHLNKRVKDPEFAALYKGLRKHLDYDEYIRQALEGGDKKAFKDSGFDQLFTDISAAADSGHLSEFLELIDYNGEYTDDEINDIIKSSAVEKTAEAQRTEDTIRENQLEEAIESLTSDIEEEDDDGNKVYNKRKLTKEQKKDLEEFTAELEEVKKRLAEDNYQTKYESDFFDSNGDMTITPESRAKVREILEGNREKLKNTISDFLKTRNDIDIETNGTLDTDKLNFLTYLKMKILDYDTRSAEMAWHLASNLEEVLKAQKDVVKKIEKDLAKAETKYKEASDSNKEKAKEELDKAKLRKQNMENLIAFLEALSGDRETSLSSSVNMASGYFGERISKLIEFFNRIGSTGKTEAQQLFDPSKINHEEMQNLLFENGNTGKVFLKGAIFEAFRRGHIESKLAFDLINEVEDLFEVGKLKREYRNKVREYIGDPSYINDTMQKNADKRTEKEKNNKAEEMSLRILNARNLLDLDNIMVKLRQSETPEVVDAAFKKAIEKADDKTKKFLEEYKTGYTFLLDLFKIIPLNSSQSVLEGLSGTIKSNWEAALENSTNLKSDFIDYLKKAADKLKTEGEARGDQDITEQGKLLEKLLSELEATAAATTTMPESSVTPPVATMSPEEAMRQVQQQAAQQQQQQQPSQTTTPQNQGGQTQTPPATSTTPPATNPPATNPPATPATNPPAEENKPDSYDSIITDLNTFCNDKLINNKGEISALPEALKRRIDTWNSTHSEEEWINAESLMTNKINEYLETKNRSIDDDDDNNNTSNGTGGGSRRSSEMKGERRTSFLGERVSQYQFDKTHPVDFVPSQELEKAIQEILIATGAYDIINSGILQALLSDLDNIPSLRFLRSTSSKIVENEEKEPAIFLALEWNDDFPELLKQYFGKDTNINPTKVKAKVGEETKDFIIIGCLSCDKEADPLIADAYKEFCDEINSELNPQVASELEKGDKALPFVASNVEGDVGQVFTGRLNEGDAENKVDLLSLMSDVLEYKNGIEFLFGFNIDHRFISKQKSTVSPNQELLNKKGNNGAIFIMVRKPDGQYYPIRCTRKTLSELDKDEEFLKEGGLLDKYLDDWSNGVGNTYFNALFNALKTLFDVKQSWQDRMSAKILINRFFLFGNDQINFYNDNIGITVNDRGSIAVSGINQPNFDVKQGIRQFFKALKESIPGIKMSLPNEGEVADHIKGNDVIKANIFKVGLASMTNFNASFLVVPRNEKGVVEVTAAPINNIPGSRRVRPGSYTLTYKGTAKTYLVDTEDGVTITSGGHVIEDSEELAYVCTYLDIIEGKYPSLFETAIEDTSKAEDLNEGVREYLKGLAEKENEKIYVVTVGNRHWKYEKMANSSSRYSEIDDAELARLKNAMLNKVNEAISTYLENNPINSPENGPAVPGSTNPEIVVDEGKPQNPETPTGPTGPTGPTAKSGIFVGKTISEIEDGNAVGDALKKMRDFEEYAKAILAALQAAEPLGRLADIDLSDFAERLEIAVRGDDEEEVDNLRKEAEQWKCKRT